MSALNRIVRLERFATQTAAPLVMPDEAAYPVAVVAQLFGARLDAPGVVERFWATLGYAVGPEDRDAALADVARYFAISQSCEPEPYPTGWVDYLIRLNAELYGLDAAALRAAGRRIAGPGAT